MKKPLRKIIKRHSRRAWRTAGVRGYDTVEVIDLYLECGHIITRVSSRAPKTKARCSRCRARKKSAIKVLELIKS